MSPYLPPATAAVRAAVRTQLTSRLVQGTLQPGDLVLVACSGGPDSLALAAATAFVAPRAGLRAGAVNVHHGLQPGSGQVSRAAIGQCRDLGLQPAWVQEVDDDVSGPVSGPEGYARRLRYAALERAAASSGAVAVLLGHTLDDQAETVLLALGRGSGARAMAGMAPVREQYLRPLLGITREQTVTACTEADLHAWHDPTNQPQGPWRSAAGDPLPRSLVRSEVLPALRRALGPGVPQALARTAELARADADLLEELAADLLAGARVNDHDQGATAVVLDAAALAKAPAALRTRALRAGALAAGSPAGSLKYDHVAGLDRLLLEYRGQGPIALPGPVWAGRRCDTLVLSVDRQWGATPTQHTADRHQLREQER